MGPKIKENFRFRKSYGKIDKVVEFPNLIDIQKRSYSEFLQLGVPVDEREDTGIQGVFKSVFPIKDFNETSTLEFVSYNLDKPKYDIDECIARGMTYAAPLKVVIRLVIWDVDDATEMRSIRDVKEKEVKSLTSKVEEMSAQIAQLDDEIRQLIKEIAVSWS